MSERTTLTAPAAARARAEVIAERLALTSPAAAVAYAEGSVHRANAEIRPEPVRSRDRFVTPRSFATEEPRPPPVRGKPPRLELSARSIKVTLVVEPATLTGFVVPNGGEKVRFRVRVGERKLVGELNPKTVRKVIAAVAEHGPEAVACVIQGKLDDGDVIEEAGITAQVKGAKP